MSEEMREDFINYCYQIKYLEMQAAIFETFL